MTIHQLSPICVKVQVTAEEARCCTAPEGITRLIYQMLLRAEEISRIPLSALPVSVELLAMPEGGMTAYFTVIHRGNRTRWRAARFSDYGALKACCRQLTAFRGEIRKSTLHRYHGEWVLSLQASQDAAAPRHLLLEYGRPYRLSGLNRARLCELGDCLHEANAIDKIAGEDQRSV